MSEGALNYQSKILELGSPISTDQLGDIEQELHLKHNKWDTQIGDTNVLSEQPLVLSQVEWNQLCKYSEQLAHEVVSLENHVLENRNLQPELGVHPHIWKILSTARNQRSHQMADGIRNMRFDFHLTKSGWIVSEVNSDVPGGWMEGAVLPKLYKPYCHGLSMPPSPLDMWGEAIQSIAPDGLVALLHAPGYMEDQQVVRSFMSELDKRKIRCALIQSPAALEWSDSDCKLRGERVGMVVRFYQIEWLCSLPRKTGWQKLLSATQIPVVNPTISAISESKRLPLLLKNLTGYQALKKFIPESRDPQEIDTKDWDNWVLKACFSNTGDSVHICGNLPQKTRQSLIKKALQRPLAWVAQKRFETLPVLSRRGLLYPCIGVFVINGKAAGAYVRLSSGQVTDFRAIETPMFLRQV